MQGLIDQLPLPADMIGEIAARCVCDYCDKLKETKKRGEYFLCEKCSRTAESACQIEQELGTLLKEFDDGQTTYCRLNEDGSIGSTTKWHKETGFSPSIGSFIGLLTNSVRVVPEPIKELVKNDEALFIAELPDLMYFTERRLRALGFKDESVPICLRLLEIAQGHKELFLSDERGFPEWRIEVFSKLVCAFYMVENFGLGPAGIPKVFHEPRYAKYAQEIKEVNIAAMTEEWERTRQWFEEREAEIMRQAIEALEKF